jgi:phenylpyruvate tautomerase PptA (4-oxalocrotonate tautomerase family)
MSVLASSNGSFATARIGMRFVHWIHVARYGATPSSPNQDTVMPMIDVTLPEGALAPQAEARLMEELTDTLIRHEGLDPDNPRVRDVTWIFVHRPAAVYRAGALAPTPIYRIVPTVPEGQYTDAARAGLIADVTAAVARAEGVPVDAVATRVWVFPTEIDDGRWGSRGVVRRLPDIMDYFGGATLRALGEQRLANKRRTDALTLVDAVSNALRDADPSASLGAAAGAAQ